jgi:hypothetical protein
MVDLAPARDLCSYIEASPSPFHAVEETVRRLRAAGFSELRESEEWILRPGDARYVTRADASVIAFRVGDRSPVEAGFRIIGEEGPFLAPPHLLTSNMLWDTRMLGADRLIDVQHGGVIGLAVKSLGPALVDTPQGRVRANRHHLITPHYTGTQFHDAAGRWVKGLIEAKGEIIEYALSA